MSQPNDWWYCVFAAKEIHLLAVNQTVFFPFSGILREACENLSLGQVNKLFAVFVAFNAYTVFASANFVMKSL